MEILYVTMSVERGVKKAKCSPACRQGGARYRVNPTLIIKTVGQ